MLEGSAVNPFRNSGRDSLYVQHDVFYPGIDKLSKGKGNDTLI